MKSSSREQKSTWIAGVNPVWESFQEEAAGIEELLVVRKPLADKDKSGLRPDIRPESQKFLQIMELAKKKGTPLRYVSKETLSGLVGHEHHQGLALRARPFDYAQLETFLAQEMDRIEPLVLLDSIQDPQNLGAVLRSACFLGAKGVVIPKDRAAAVTSTVIKVAAGATAYLPIMQVTNLARSLEQLKERGLWIAGLAPEGQDNLYDVELSIPLGLVVGNEQKGLRPLVRRNCDLLISIPGTGPLQSLNAAVAAAIVLAEVQRQRRKKL
jgi:23S rRNA (guanosine2251-2'-O)-methyltransferase